jgi:hypothetical protein
VGGVLERSAGQDLQYLFADPAPRQFHAIALTGVGEGDGSFATGTYEVNPDCTGTVTITLVTPRGPVPLEARFVVEGQGREIVEVPATAGNVGVAILKRQ